MNVGNSGKKTCFKHGEKFSLFSAIASLLTLTATAQAAFVDLGAGARAPGMGNAFTAVADDVFAIHYNPAGLALLERPEFGSSYTRLLLGLSDNSDLSQMFLGYAHPLRQGRGGTLGLSWEQFALDRSLYQEQSFAASYARLLAGNWGGGNLYGGVNARYLRRGFGSFPEAANSTSGGLPTANADPVLKGRNSVGAPDADIGALYRFKDNYAVGLALDHVLQPDMAFSRGDTDKVPMSAKLGLSYRSILSNLGLQYETRRAPTGTRDQTLSMAAERWFPRLLVGDFGLRGALNLGSRDLKTLSLGFSYRTRRLSVDYGFALPIGSIASTAGSHRLGFSVRFGSPREPDESVLMILEAMRQLKKGGAPELRALGLGLTASQKALLDEHVAIAKSLQSQAKYQAALDRLGQALAVSPGDTDLLKVFGRLNWVAQQIKELPEHRGDPVQSAWHQGVLAYLGADNPGAIERVAHALSLKPEDKALDGFLAQLELATGLKRPAISPAAAKQYLIEQILARASLAIEEGRYDDVVSLSREVLREDEANLSAWENLGTSYFAIGDYEPALVAWERASALEKNPARRSLLRGYMKSIRGLLAGRRTPAQAPPSAGEAPAPPPETLRPTTSEERLRLSPRDIQKVYNAGVDYYTAGQLEKAKDAFEEVLRSDPAYVPAVKALRRVDEELAQK